LFPEEESKVKPISHPEGFEEEVDSNQECVVGFEMLENQSDRIFMFR
jgi:hypothetical protein